MEYGIILQRTHTVTQTYKCTAATLIQLQGINMTASAYAHKLIKEKHIYTLLIKLINRSEEKQINHMYIHIHVHTYTCTCTCTYIYMYIHIHVHVYVHTYTCTYIPKRKLKWRMYIRKR